MMGTKTLNPSNHLQTSFGAWLRHAGCTARIPVLPCRAGGRVGLDYPNLGEGPSGRPDVHPSCATPDPQVLSS
jgi:hypothetical protein